MLHPPRRRSRAAAVAVFVPLASALLPISAASAHSALLGTNPRDGATVRQAPDAVTLTFNEAPRGRYSVIHVVGPDGTRRDSGPVRVVDDAATESLVGERPAGTYTVDWRIVSADGHPVSGSFRFTAAAAATAPAPAASPTAVSSLAATPAAAPASASASASSGGGNHLGHVAIGLAGAALVGLAWLYERATRRRRADA